MVRAAVHRLRLTQRELDVVLGGGIVRSDSKLFHGVVRAGLADAAPHARVVIVAAPPVVGAALLGLDQLPGRSPAAARSAARNVHKSLTAGTLA